MPVYRTVFISHAHADNVLCERVARGLVAKGIDVWIDLTRMPDGDSLSDRITNELLNRQAFVLMLSDSSNVSRWVGLELDEYQNWVNNVAQRYVDRQVRKIIPVLLNDGLALQVTDQRTQEKYSTNHAKTDHIKGIDGVNRSGKAEVDDLLVKKIVEDIAHALEITGVRHTEDSPRPSQQIWTPAPTPARLAQLGFTGRRYNGVECLFPPTVPVAAGQFIMGSDKAKDSQAWDDETPQYLIHVDQFAMGTYPVTVAEYALYLRANPNVAPPGDYTYPSDASWAAPEWRGKTLTWAIQQQQRFDHPVVMVTWENARDYTAWLAQLTKYAFRLPTEAQWEKAARGTDGRLYPWGNTWDARRANTADGGPNLTTPIGQYTERGDASPYGCHDMVGNLWEWCSSYFKPYPYDQQNSEQSDDKNSDYIIRGGSWRNEPCNARAAGRNSYRNVRDYDLGFRLACAGPGPG